MNKQKRVKEKGLALSQIFILVISIVAFAYFIGNEFQFVSAANPDAIVDAAKKQQMQPKLQQKPSKHCKLQDLFPLMLLLQHLLLVCLMVT